MKVLELMPILSSTASASSALFAGIAAKRARDAVSLAQQSRLDDMLGDYCLRLVRGKQSVEVSFINLSPSRTAILPISSARLSSWQTIPRSRVVMPESNSHAHFDPASATIRRPVGEVSIGSFEFGTRVVFAVSPISGRVSDRINLALSIGPDDAMLIDGAAVDDVAVLYPSHGTITRSYTND